MSVTIAFHRTYRVDAGPAGFRASDPIVRVRDALSSQAEPRSCLRTVQDVIHFPVGGGYAITARDPSTGSPKRRSPSIRTRVRASPWSSPLENSFHAVS
jgi:hypothetical protein